ncbi:DUF6174 domain-containing protein [Streptomyces sp. NBC_01304]|uniref:DUF6174 domain-containing protein n=1 Tax=Streptomyces sp. NBC_01304 TaxID=2903818 RepID=UPI002E13B008|nr:DUF6174 domain-containing protein [Streptomyces sp. NBC_01304]
MHRKAGRTGRTGLYAVPGLVLALALGVTGCSDGTPRASTGTTAPGKVRAAEWEEPAAYAYTLESLGGERGGLGKYRITVRDHKVVKAVGLDEPGRRFVKEAKLDRVPTLGDLLDEYEDARGKEHADVAELENAADGHPMRINLDYLKNAIDDEAEYLITKYRQV